MSAGVTSALPVGMKEFKNLLTSVSPDIAICVRGRHAVGKSEGVYQAASGLRSDFYKDADNCAAMIKAMGGKQGKIRHADGWRSSWTYEDGVPVMERRLSQMTEGDTIGLPFKGEHGTMFQACDWLILCCEFPALLFLDERNRALDGVKQSVFQLCDSKAFYGNRLHDETRVCIAENVGEEYEVQSCDPAEVSRCATVVLEPSEKDWLEYVADKCDPATIEFIRTNANKLENKGNFEPNKKYPDRRSWFNLDQELQRLGLFETPEDMSFYVLAGAMVGVETGSQFANFCKERDRQVSAADVLKNWKKAKKRLAGKASVSNEMYIEVVAKLTDFLKDHKLVDDEGQQIAQFMHDCPMEICMTAWAALQNNIENLFIVHPYIEKLMVQAARCKETGEMTTPTTKDVAKAAAGGALKKAATKPAVAVHASKNGGGSIAETDSTDDDEEDSSSSGLGRGATKRAPTKV